MRASEKLLLGYVPKLLSDGQLETCIFAARHVAGKLRQDAKRAPQVKPRADAMADKAREFEDELDRR